MKTILNTLYCALVAFIFVGCSEDKDKEGMTFNPDDQELTIVQGEATSTTFSFDVQVKDTDIPYLCLYVDKSTIDRVPKGELPDYLMNELKMQAEKKGLKFQDYVASLAITGNLTGKVIDGLLPGQIYELVAFAVSGTRIANKAEYLFFETPVVDAVDCTFDVKANVAPYPIELIVAPTNKDVDFYFNLMKKSDFDAYVEGGYTVDDIIGALFQNDFSTAMAQVAPDGQLSAEGLEELQRILFRKGETTYRVVGLVPETEYVWMAVAFKVAEIDNAFHITMASVVSSGSFISAPKPGNGMEFDIEARSVQSGTIQLNITPSMQDESYLWYYEAISEENNTLTGQELAAGFMNERQDELDVIKVSGSQEINIEGLRPETDYYVLAWGYDGNVVTTLPCMYEFRIDADGILAGNVSKALPFVDNSFTIVPVTKLNTVFLVRK
ncbi:hypothetical protein [uncultured Mediterranea sp.]|uniref:hypothetical protein n=1 Tax=uncultured Mediterranea sp. TaxID=1926662 RepID=UPI0027D96B13|nr:hypothetical protein [uncultured Mediterranea sp.]